MENSEKEKKRRMEEFLQKQRLPYKSKVNYAQRRAYDFANECWKRDLNMHDTLCKGLELLQESNEVEGLRAFNMLRNMDGLRKETTEGATV